MSSKLRLFITFLFALEFAIRNVEKRRRQAGFAWVKLLVCAENLIHWVKM
jgi:hypothetical protein